MNIFNTKNVQFGSFFQQIQEYLTSVVGGSGLVNKSSVFGQLLTMVSGIAHNIMLYIEDAMTEQNKFTAQRKKSVFGLAAQTGYQPSYGKAAGVWVKLSYKANNKTGLNIILQDHQRVMCTQNGLYYNMILDGPAEVIRTDKSLCDHIYLVQGKFNKQTFTVSGGPLYPVRFEFLGYIDVDYIQVMVNGTQWKRRSCLYDMMPDEEAFIVKYNPISGCDLLFGNGLHGRQLKDGDEVVVSYLTHDGASGNLSFDPSTSFIFTDTLRDTTGEEVDGNEVLDIRFATEDSVAAGADSEHISIVREMIGYQSRSLCLADPNNFKEFISKYSFCGYNRTWSEPGSMVVNSLIMKNYHLTMKRGVDYFNLKESDFILSAIQKKSIYNALSRSGQMMAGTVFNIMDMKLVKYAMYVYVTLTDSSLDKDIISNNIKEQVGTFFGNIQSDQYIPKSDIAKLIKSNVDGVDGVNIYFLSQRNEEARRNRKYTETTYTYNQKTGTYDVNETTIPLYYITNDDGTMAIENPMLGLDAHGNILVQSDFEFPVLMGGWSWLNKQQQEVYTEPITISFETI